MCIIPITITTNSIFFTVYCIDTLLAYAYAYLADLSLLLINSISNQFYLSILLYFTYVYE